MEEEPLEVLEALKLELLGTARRLQQLRPSTLGTFEGVTPAEARTLLMISMAWQAKGEETVRPGHIAGHMHVSPSAFSQLLKGLERKGLVTRGREAGDFRAVSLALTPEGRDIAAKIEDRWSHQALELVKYVGIDDLRTMVRTANKMADYFEKAQSGELEAPYLNSFVSKDGQQDASFDPCSCAASVAGSSDEGGDEPCA